MEEEAARRPAADRKTPNDVEGTGIVMRTDHRHPATEFRYGSMFRSIPLPRGIKEDDITASYKDGVLEVKAPMPEDGSGSGKQTIPVSRG